MAQVWHWVIHEKNRNLLAIFLFALNALSTLLSVSLLGISFYVFFYFLSEAYLLGDDISFSVFGPAYFFVAAFISLQQFCLCFSLNYLRKSRHRITFMKKGFLDYFIYSYVFTTFIALPLIVIYSVWFVSQITTGFVRGMKHKLKRYSTDIKERIAFNRLQFQHQCCGAQRYDDWKDVQEFRLDDGKLKSVPFSCCKIKTISPCFNGGLTNLTTTTINTGGCAIPFKNFISERIYWAIGLWLLILGLHLLTLILLQYWKTSLETAVKYGNSPKSRGEGYLWLPYIGIYKGSKELITSGKEGRPLIADKTRDSPTKRSHRYKQQKDYYSERDQKKNVITSRYRPLPPPPISEDETTIPPFPPPPPPQNNPKSHKHTSALIAKRVNNIPEPPLLSSEEVSSAPPLSPRYNLLAPELYNKMQRKCQKCGRHTFQTGTHVCLGQLHDHSSALMAFTDEDLTGAEDSDSSSRGIPNEYEKNYKNNPLVDKLMPKNNGKTSKIEPRKVEQRFTTTDDTTDTNLDALKRKYRERYFILKEIR